MAKFRNAASTGTGSYRLLAAACFAVWMILTVYRHHEKGPFVLVSAVGAGLLGWLFLTVLGWLIYLVDAPAGRALGRSKIHGAVDRGFLLAVPFALLASEAVLGLGWDAALPVAAAGLMTAGAAAAAELLPPGEGSVRTARWVLPTLATAALSAGWVVLGARLADPLSTAGVSGAGLLPGPANLSQAVVGIVLPGAVAIGITSLGGGARRISSAAAGAARPRSSRAPQPEAVPPPSPQPPPAALTCRQCGAVLQRAARFCEECGAPTAPRPSPAAPACPQCGSQVKPGARFCGNCGAELA